MKSKIDIKMQIHDIFEDIKKCNIRPFTEAWCFRMRYIEALQWVLGEEDEEVDQ